MKKKIALIAVGLMMTFSSIAFGDTITFDELSGISSTSIDYAEVTFTYTGGLSGNILKSQDRGSDLLPLSNIVIIGDVSNQPDEWYVAIFKPGVTVKSVSVDLGDYNQDSDNLILYAYDLLNNQIGSATDTLPAELYGGKTLTVTTSESIAYVKYNGFGEFPGSVFMDNFTYTATNAVSEPLTMLLLGLGLTSLVALRRRFGK